MVESKENDKRSDPPQTENILEFDQTVLGKRTQAEDGEYD